ncbi:hypothetical protein [Yoonia sp. 2307UL14-13]|uniref:hypothetical protein n=1 Tax=Yoonia sp. 2307UL14-13 TaxID=3126506 RepID=UPI0030A82F90
MRLLLLAISPILLTACMGGGGGGGDVSQPQTEIEMLRGEADRLRSAFGANSPTPSINIPPSGSVMYEGIATLGFFTESARGDGIGGDMMLDVDFAENGVTGQIDNFYSRDGDAREGQLALTNGQVVRVSDGALITADVAGNVDIVAGPKDLDGTLTGVFVGENVDYVGGTIDVAFPLTLGGDGGVVDVDVDGSFIVEKRN